MSFLYVALGGALGAVCRYLLGTTIQGLMKASNFPVGTITVNLIGCFLIGLIMGLIEFRSMFGSDGRLFIVVGVLGGFTTFSTFGYETLQLIKEGQIAAALINVLLQTGLGLVMVWLGNVASR
jgi:fluoride exporter